MKPLERILKKKMNTKLIPGFKNLLNPIWMKIVLIKRFQEIEDNFGN